LVSCSRGGTLYCPDLHLAGDREISGLAHQAITAEPDIGLLLPCNVVVREGEGGVVIAFMDPAAVLQLVERPEMHELGKEVRSRLERVRDSLKG